MVYCQFSLTMLTFCLPYFYGFPHPHSTIGFIGMKWSLVKSRHRKHFILVQLIMKSHICLMCEMRLWRIKWIGYSCLGYLNSNNKVTAPTLEKQAAHFPSPWNRWLFPSFASAPAWSLQKKMWFINTVIFCFLPQSSWKICSASPHVLLAIGFFLFFTPKTHEAHSVVIITLCCYASSPLTGAAFGPTICSAHSHTHKHTQIRQAIDSCICQHTSLSWTVSMVTAVMDPYHYPIAIEWITVIIV